jgi:hypothetical protein
MPSVIQSISGSLREFPGHMPRGIEELRNRILFVERTFVQRGVLIVLWPLSSLEAISFSTSSFMYILEKT